jgi:hypothetical protein
VICTDCTGSCKSNTIAMAHTAQYKSGIVEKQALIMKKVMVTSVLSLTNRLNWLFIVLFNWNNSPQVRHVASIGHSISESEASKLLPYSLMLHAYRRCNKYKLQSFLWSDRGPTLRSTTLEASMPTITPRMLFTHDENGDDDVNFVFHQ